jgi:hypothetical protein
MVRMKSGNGSMSSISDRDPDPNIEKAFRDLKLYLGKKLYVMHREKGRAKYYEGEKGTVSMICYEELPSPLDPANTVMEFYALHYRSSFWKDGWREHCSFPIESAKYSDGFTITENIWSDILMLGKGDPIQLVIRLPTEIYFFQKQDLINFQNKYRSTANNQNDMSNPKEYCFPKVLYYKYESFLGKETYNR